VAADAEVVKDTVKSPGLDFVLQFAKAHRMDDNLGLHARKAPLGKRNGVFVAVKGMERSVFVEAKRNRVGVSGTAKRAIGIRAIGLDVQGFQTFCKHHRIMVESDTLFICM
jgi:hypothetical protein